MISFCDILRVISKIVNFCSIKGSNQLEYMPEVLLAHIMKASLLASNPLAVDHGESSRILRGRAVAEAVESAGNTWGSLGQQKFTQQQGNI